MPYKIKFLFILFIVSISCKKEESITLTSKNFSEEFKENCKGDNCAKVTIDYIKFEGEKVVVDKINYTIGSSIIYFLNSNLEKKLIASTITEAANIFIKGYEADRKEFPDLSPYDAELTVLNSKTSSEIISVKTRFYSYTGGAHGNSIFSFLNFDPKTGNVMTTNSILKNKKEFTDFVENIFREKNNIPEGESINSTGFWFDKETFKLPETIGFSETNLVIIYNQYEIASYADGPIEVLIPIEEVKPYLNF
ncbi:MAG: DUF3298 and DUF4163 domain-containing protein [Flavobacteriaceae bacterium]|nr:DUF3298 and DUF4163 domain-containing protein [Flavobacteriaceae bacterium]